MKTPLLTITIPTFNSGAHLSLCLEAINKQTYKNIEINIIDNNSRDNTVEIAQKNGVKKIKNFPGSLLQARFEGVKMAKGEFILILDSDQILAHDAIERAVTRVMHEKIDMLAFEELTYKTDTFIEKLFDMDRKLINAVNNLDPFTGVIMPRFFRASLLKTAYNNIPKEIFPKTGGPDHAIVYYESWVISRKVGVLPRAVYHQEPSSLAILWKKFFRWGYTSVYAHYGKYAKLMSQKERFRTGLFTKGLFIESIGSIILLLLKGLAFKIGYYKGKLERVYTSSA